MAAVYKINEDFYNSSFLLIALHSTMEDYSLAYAINHVIKGKFKRTRKNLEIGDFGSYATFEWEDHYSDCYWLLMKNISTMAEQRENKDLFSNEPTLVRSKLVPELKEVDYFLKVEDGTSTDSHVLLKNLLSIPKVLAAYEVEINKLKSKNNLIF